MQLVELCQPDAHTRPVSSVAGLEDVAHGQAQPGNSPAIGEVGACRVPIVERAGEGDDEQIIVRLDAVPSNVKTLMFTVNSFTSVTFNEIENAFCRLFDESTGREIARYNLSCNGNHTAMIMAKVYRHNAEWKMHAIGENAHGRTFEDLLPAMSRHL